MLCHAHCTIILTCKTRLIKLFVQWSSILNTVPWNPTFILAKKKKLNTHTIFMFTVLLYFKGMGLLISHCIMEQITKKGWWIPIRVIPSQATTKHPNRIAWANLLPWINSTIKIVRNYGWKKGLYINWLNGEQGKGMRCYLCLLEMDEIPRARMHSRWEVLQNRLILHSQGLVIKTIKRGRPI